PPDESGRAVAVAIADVAASRGVSRIRDARPPEAVHGPGRGITPRGSAPRRGAVVAYPLVDPEMLAPPQPQTIGRGIG
ncbi:MAG TPA: hypothetical protein VIN65_01610, partial [Candidatus Dormibacteraeota bacterium]